MLIVWSVADKRDTQTPRNCERNIKRQWYMDTDTAKAVWGLPKPRTVGSGGAEVVAGCVIRPTDRIVDSNSPQGGYYAKSSLPPIL